MKQEKRSGCDAKAAASSDIEGYVTTLHPEGSFNDLQFDTERRKLHRPQIHYTPVLLRFAVSILLTVIINAYRPLLGTAALFIYVFIMRKHIVIWFIHVYQHFAPDRIRKACVFEPSCSEYMILSLQKYGLIYGAYKGVNRLLRCHSPNGGEDYP